MRNNFVETNLRQFYSPFADEIGTNKASDAKSRHFRDRKNVNYSS